MSGINDRVMRQYLDALLNEDAPSPKAVKATQTKANPVALKEQVSAVNVQPIEQLLAQVPDEDVAQQVEASPQPAEVQQQHIAQQAEKLLADEQKQQQNQSKQAVPLRAPQAAREQYMEGEFQALFFDVAGLTLAVPLKSLGGIHQITEVNQLFGKPAWFKGVMLNREEKINLVDTARWVMPEKYDKNLEQALNYKYVIMLGESQWGLSAENLINNVTLKAEDVKWRQSHGKRPWLAGVIKDKMCALIDVENLQLLLEQGFDSQDH